MKKGAVRTLCVFMTCLMMMTLMPINSSAASEKHWMYFENNGGTKSTNFAVYDDSQFTLPTAPTKKGYVFDGWIVKRLKDGKFYASGKGWVSNSKGAKKYGAKKTLIFDRSWRKGSAKSNYRFYAQWHKDGVNKVFCLAGGYKIYVNHSSLVKIKTGNDLVKIVAKVIPKTVSVWFHGHKYLFNKVDKGRGIVWYISTLYPTPGINTVWIKAQ